MNETDSIETTSEISLGSIRDSLVKLKRFHKTMRIGRILLYIFGIWTFLIYYWNILGISIGVGIFLTTEHKPWRRHGLVLSYSNVLLALAMNVYAFLWILLLYLFIIIYLLGSLVLQGGRLILTGIRRVLKKQKVPSEKEVESPSRFGGILLRNLKLGRRSIKIKTIMMIVLLATPFLLWSNINLDFGVMFDNSPTLLWVQGPSTADLGTDFEIAVEAWDSFERLSGSYRGTVDFSIQSYNLTTGLLLTGVDASFPDAYTFTGGLYTAGIVPAYMLGGFLDYGLHSFQIQINTVGVHYILVEDSLTQNTYWSNPIIVDNFVVDSPRIYWGDVHAHSLVSDGSGSPDESYYYGRYISRLEFMALTDHGEDFTLFDRSKTGTAEFRSYTQATSNAYAPGEFVSFFGAEWTTTYADQPLIFVPGAIILSTGGHYTCIFSDDSMPIFSAITEKTTDDLWTVLDDFTSTTEARALAIPHHTIRNQFIQDWTLMNPDYVKLVEVTSVHGECLFDNELNYRGSVDLPPERVPGSSVIDAINMGYRMTFMANGDNHDGHPGHSISHTRARVGHQYPYTLYHARNGHPYPSGITAVYATSLTRSGVFDGLESGRVYANSDHGRPILDLSINGVSMGYNSTVTVPTSTSARNISLFIAQDGAPVGLKNQAAFVETNWVPNWSSTVEIIKNGQLWRTVEISTPISTITITDDSTITGTSFDDYIQGTDGNYYINEHSDNPIDPASLNTGGLDYYCIRVVGANGRTSYIGPIWVQSP